VTFSISALASALTFQLTLADFFSSLL